GVPEHHRGAFPVGRPVHPPHRHERHRRLVVAAVRVQPQPGVGTHQSDRHVRHTLTTPVAQHHRVGRPRRYGRSRVLRVRRPPARTARRRTGTGRGPAHPDRHGRQPAPGVAGRGRRTGRCRGGHPPRHPRGVPVLRAPRRTVRRAGHRRGRDRLLRTDGGHRAPGRHLRRRHVHGAHPPYHLRRGTGRHRGGSGAPAGTWPGRRGVRGRVLLRRLVRVPDTASSTGHTATTPASAPTPGRGCSASSPPTLRRCPPDQVTARRPYAARCGGPRRPVSRSRHRGRLGR